MDENNASEELNNDVWKKNLPMLWLAVFLCCASFTACTPFLPMYVVRELGVTENVNFWAGLTLAVTFLGSSIMAPIWGALADHVGQRKMALRAGIGLTVTYFLTGVVQDVYQLIAVRVLTGLAAGFVPASLSMASSSLPQKKMGWGMGLMQTAVASGTIMGPLLGGYLSSWFGMRMSFYVGSAALCAATVGVWLVVTDLTVLQKGSSSIHNLLDDLKKSLRNKELLYVLFMFCMIQCCIMIVQPLVSLYVGELMNSDGNEVVEMAGVVFSVGGLAGIMSAPYWGKRGQSHGYMRTFCLVTLSAGIINQFQVFVENIPQFIAIQFAYGLFLAGAVPNINANLTEVTGKQARGKAFGLVTSAQQFGGVLGSMTGGVLGGLMPTPYILAFTGCILITLSTYSYLTRVK